MSKKPDTASALAGILKARRGDQSPAPAAAAATLPVEPESPPPPSPAPMPVASVEALRPAPKKARQGKSSDPNYDQFSVYLKKDTGKRLTGPWTTTITARISASWCNCSGAMACVTYLSNQVSRYLST